MEDNRILMENKKKEHILYRDSNLGKSNRILIYFIVFAIFIILLGKILFVESEYHILYLYGVAVTSVLFINFFIAIFKYEDLAILAKNIEIEEKNAKIKNKRPLVTCMVPVFNEEVLVEQCILSMIVQTYENKEIIFINDGSTDGTAKVLDRYAKKGLIKVIHQENVGKKRALGRAMREAKGEIFAFSDSDSIWKLNALEKIVPIFNQFPEVGAVSGHFRLKNSSTNILTRAQDSWAEGQFAIRKAFESYYGVVTCVSGPLAVFRKKAIYNFIPAWEKDSFLGQEFRFATDRTMTGFVLGAKYIGEKVRKKYIDQDFKFISEYKDEDWKVVYSKSAKAWTVLPDNFKSLLRQQVRWKKSFIRNTFFTGLFYWRFPILPSLVYYLHIIFVLVGPFIAFRHLIFLPMRGDIFAAILYIFGIVFVGFMFGFAYKLENKNCHIWIYRPIMSLLSTLMLSWVIFYSALTIKKMVWYRDS